MGAVDVDGQILVITMRRGARLVRVVGGESALLGGFGHGVDEYEALIAGGFMPQGEVGLLDAASSRLKVYSTRGTFLRSLRVPLSQDFVAASLGSGGLFVIVIPAAGAVGSPVEAQVRVIDHHDGRERVLARFAAAALTSTPGYRPTPDAFPPLAFVSACPGGGAVFAEPKRSVRIGIVEPGADTARTLVNLWSGRPITLQELDAEVRKREGERPATLTSGVATTPSEAATPTVHPPISAAVCGDDSILFRESIPPSTEDSVMWRIVPRFSQQYGRVLLGRDDDIVASHGGRWLVVRTGDNGERQLAWVSIREH